MTNKKQTVYKILGILLCVLPAAITALAYFPLWIQDGKSTISVLSLLILALCAIPARRILKRVLRSPSAWQLWLALWILTSVLDPIISGMRAVSAVAFPTSVLGALFFRLARKAGGTIASNEEEPHE